MSGNASTASTDPYDSLLERDNVKTLRSFVASKCEAGEEVEWKDLMEWFVCAVIGLESAISESNGSFWFDWDDVVVDGFGTARIILSASHSDSSPPHSPQSFSDGIVSLSLLFLTLIDTISTSNCLSKRIEPYFRKNLSRVVIRHFVHHLVNTGQLVPGRDPSKLEELVYSYFDRDTSFVDWMSTDRDGLLEHLLSISRSTSVFLLFHAKSLVNRINWASNQDVYFLLPQYRTFTELLEPEVVKMSKQFDSDIFQEATRISEWKEFLQKVAGGDEVEEFFELLDFDFQNDTSFLKLPFFRPTLLSLQAKFQQLASSLLETAGSSTSSPHSSHSSHHTSLEAHFDSSLRTHSSSSHFKQESLQLLNILHSLLTSPLPSSRRKYSPPDFTDRKLHLIQQDHVNPDEKFDSSLFDEVDNEKLVRSLVRCRSVCRLVGIEVCIRDFPVFVDRCVSVLHTTDTNVRMAALDLFMKIPPTLSTISQLPRWWNRLRSSFRDGQYEEQLCLIRISAIWIGVPMKLGSLPPFPAKEFDWDGMIHASLIDDNIFILSIDLLEKLRHSMIKIMDSAAEVTDIILSFEQCQHAVKRIVHLFQYENIQQYSSPHYLKSLLSYCVLISLQLNRDFPPVLTPFIIERPKLDPNHLTHLEQQFLFLCHSSLNPHKPHQPPIDLIFERTLRTRPLEFFIPSSHPDYDFPPTLLNTSLCGFHALCRRGVHLNLMETDFMRRETFNLFLFFPPPLVVRFFLPFLSLNEDYSYFFDPWNEMMSSLLLTTAPFGDLHSVRELYRSVGQSSCHCEDTSTESCVTSDCESIEWLNIPTGFGSALALQIEQPNVMDKCHKHSPFAKDMTKFLSDYTNNVCDGICDVASWIRDLTPANATFHLLEETTLRDCPWGMLSPVPAEVSAILEFVKRVVSLCSVESVMEMVRFGMLDIVIRGVSESSFLEDYENGICVIGILLRSICAFGKKQEMIDHDSSRLLSQTGLTFSEGLR
ncbi:hypothetical protein BLNAU_16573 [Blattamonas nauphoetae]|uniref:Uncharacterized protein n=1 Tax=Blattamonas nauphoetae TaxID=2049346 RepID=A0ABQ9XCC1_9EUKA|nr:hypothetical protein BLNAU_16573 [Blattamonas nauphoetae]